jgi:small conductance mechanosensitive channel
VLQEPEPVLLATGLATDNRLNLELRAWVRTADVQQVRSELTEAIRDGMVELGVGLPASQRDIRVFHHGMDGRALNELLNGTVIDSTKAPPAPAGQTPPHG